MNTGANVKVRRRYRSAAWWSHVRVCLSRRQCCFLLFVFQSCLRKIVPRLTLQQHGASSCFCLSRDPPPLPSLNKLSWSLLSRVLSPELGILEPSFRRYGSPKVSSSISLETRYVQVSSLPFHSCFRRRRWCRIPAPIDNNMTATFTFVSDVLCTRERCGGGVLVVVVVCARHVRRDDKLSVCGVIKPSVPAITANLFPPAAHTARPLLERRGLENYSSTGFAS